VYLILLFQVGGWQVVGGIEIKANQSALAKCILSVPVLLKMSDYFSSPTARSAEGRLQ
jgi:hypothetical protein